jgi:MscS family membrane protein
LSFEITVLLWEVLSRINLPPLSSIPDLQMMNEQIEERQARYVIPHTEISIVRIDEGNRIGEYLFSSDTVIRIEEFYKRVKDQPYLRDMTFEHPRRVHIVWGGWLLLPPKQADALPMWLKKDIGGQAVWKSLSVIAVLLVVLLLVWFVNSMTCYTSKRTPLGIYLRRMASPATFLILVPFMQYLFRYQIWIAGKVALLVQFIVPALTYLAVAWLVWQASLFMVELIISSPRIQDKGFDAHLLRLIARISGLVIVFSIFFWGGNRLGLPIYGLIAGASVGGLAIALAAQGTLENFLGSINLFLDRPVGVGDFCQYEERLGTIEEIGLRSTRIRGLDRTVTTIPNAEFSKMKITNLTKRDRILMRSVIGLRYETNPEQLRYVLAKLRELLLAHPMVTPEPARVRFIGFGEFSLNLEVYAYLATKDWNTFLEIQEDIYLRMIDVVAASGTGFAFPSQTVYFTRDQGLDPQKSSHAITEVEKWRSEHQLPFPNFDVQFRKMHRDTLDYPPKNSSTTKSKTEDKQIEKQKNIDDSKEK